MGNRFVAGTSGIGKTTLAIGLIMNNVLELERMSEKLIVIDWGQSYRALSDKVDQIQYIDLNEPDSNREFDAQAKCIVVEMPISRDYGDREPAYDYVVQLVEACKDRKIIIDEVASFHPQFVEQLLEITGNSLCLAQDVNDIPEGIASPLVVSMNRLDA